jgi:hypothetical protein
VLRNLPGNLPPGVPGPQCDARRGALALQCMCVRSVRPAWLRRTAAATALGAACFPADAEDSCEATATCKRRPALAKWIASAGHRADHCREIILVPLRLQVHWIPAQPQVVPASIADEPLANGVKVSPLVCFNLYPCVLWLCCFRAMAGSRTASSCLYCHAGRGSPGMGCNCQQTQRQHRAGAVMCITITQPCHASQQFLH